MCQSKILLRLPLTIADRPVWLSLTSTACFHTVLQIIYFLISTQTKKESNLECKFLEVLIAVPNSTWSQLVVKQTGSNSIHTPSFPQTPPITRNTNHVWNTKMTQTHNILYQTHSPQHSEKRSKEAKIVKWPLKYLTMWHFIGFYRCYWALHWFRWQH